MVYFTDQKVWSEYKAVLPWDISSFLFWREFMLLCCKTLCDFQITRTEYELYVDFAKKFTSGQTVDVQPCAQNIPTYTGVTRYTSPLVMSPVLSERDVTVLYDGVLTNNWAKLNSEEISISGVVDGKQLTFFYKVAGSFNGAVLYEDSVIQTLNNVSFGVVPLNNFCELLPYSDITDSDATPYEGAVDSDGNPVYANGNPLQFPSLWGCSGGVCSVSPTGTYASQAQCEAARTLLFTGGQCAGTAYTVTWSLYGSYLGGAPVGLVVGSAATGAISAIYWEWRDDGVGNSYAETVIVSASGTSRTAAVATLTPVKAGWVITFIIMSITGSPDNCGNKYACGV
jgi:hypothetical protein